MNYTIALIVFIAVAYVIAILLLAIITGAGLKALRRTTKRIES